MDARAQAQDGSALAWPSAYVYGRPGTGKTAVVRAVLSAPLLPPHAVAYVDGVECCTTRLLLERALAQWGVVSPVALTIADALRHLKRLPPTATPRYLIVDRAERLRAHGPTFFAALLRLHELVRAAHTHALSTAFGTRPHLRAGACE